MWPRSVWWAREAWLRGGRVERRGHRGAVLATSVIVSVSVGVRVKVSVPIEAPSPLCSVLTCSSVISRLHERHMRLFFDPPLPVAHPGWALRSSVNLVAMPSTRFKVSRILRSLSCSSARATLSSSLRKDHKRRRARCATVSSVFLHVSF